MFLTVKPCHEITTMALLSFTMAFFLDKNYPGWLTPLHLQKNKHNKLDSISVRPPIP